MKRFTKETLLGKDVATENLDLDSWQKPITKESPQTLRNTSRIEQLEAGQAELKKKQFEQALMYLSQFAHREPAFHAHLSWRDLAEIPERIYKFEEDLSFWHVAQLAIQPIGAAIDQIAPPYHEKLSAVTKLFGELEEDFDDVARRITRCAILEKELAGLENSLEGEETEHLGWCVSLIRDVLDYNYAEDLTQTHLGLLKKAIVLVHDKGSDCNKEDYQSLHKEFLQTGLALLPTTKKAIEKYGD